MTASEPKQGWVGDKPKAADRFWASLEFGTPAACLTLLAGFLCILPMYAKMFREMEIAPRGPATFVLKLGPAGPWVLALALAGMAAGFLTIWFCERPWWFQLRSRTRSAITGGGSLLCIALIVVMVLCLFFSLPLHPSGSMQ